MSNFERRFGKYAIRNLSLVLILCYVVGYVIEFFAPELENYMTLNTYAIIFHGQIWRLITWVLIPPSSLNIFTIITLLFYYNIGSTLEHVWGTYRYNVYIFSGMLFTIIGSFIAMGLYYLLGGSVALAEVNFAGLSTLFSTYYINMSIFLAFAVTFPDMQVLLMFVIPVKMKYMGIAYAVLLALDFVMGAGNVLVNVFYRISIVASLLNFLLFWLQSRRRHLFNPKQTVRRQKFRAEVKRSAAQQSKITRHKCAICGRTEEDDPELEFRFCSKCNGNYEYCQYHLFTHEHVK